MKALPLGGRSVPIPVYGVIVIIVVLVCLIVLVRHGSDTATATASIVTLVVTAADVTRRLLQPSGPGDNPGRQPTPDA